MRFDTRTIPRQCRRTHQWHTRTLALAACALLSALPETAQASDVIFGGASPLVKFINFITGIFAYMLVIVGIVITLGGLIFGNDMSGFARRAPLVVVAGGVLILSKTVVTSLFGGSQGAELPHDMIPHIVAPAPEGSELPEDVPGGQGWRLEDTIDHEPR